MAVPVAATHTRNLTNSVVNITAGIAQIVAIVITNTISPAATAFVQFFDAVAADVTLGTTRPTIVIHVPTGATAVLGTSITTFNYPCLFGTRMSAAATATAEGSGAPGTGVFLQVFVN